MKLSNKYTIPLLFVAALFAAGCAGAVATNESPDNPSHEDSSMTAMDDKDMKGEWTKEEMDAMDDDMMGDDVDHAEAKTDEMDAQSLDAPAYLAYTPELHSELDGKKPYVLFFHAAWCSTCLKMEKAIKSDLDSFPDGTKIIEASFDDELELRKRYSVRTQSIIVVVNADGEVVKTVADPPVASLKSFIKASFL